MVFIGTNLNLITVTLNKDKQIGEKPQDSKDSTECNETNQLTVQCFMFYVFGSMAFFWLDFKTPCAH